MRTGIIVPKPEDSWPVFHTNGGSAATTNLLASPGLNLSWFITGMVLSGGAAGDGFQIIRRSCPLFNSGSDTLTISDAASLQMGTGNLALELWLKTSDVSLGALLDKFDSNDGYKLETTSGGQIKATIGDGATTKSITSINAFNDNNWHHIFLHVQRGSTDTMDLYIDGNSAATQVDISAVTGNINANGQDLVLTGTNGKSFRLSTFGVYKKASGAVLTAAQILARYADGVGYKYAASEDNMSVSLNLDEGTGTACKDWSGNSNDGTLSATSWQNDGIPIDPHTLKLTSQFICSTAGSSGPLALMFPQAIKVGRNNPLTIIETDGAFTLTLFGYADDPS